jgi:DNA polymerase kappa
MNVLRRYDESMAPASLDEAYLNITAFLVSTGRSAEDVVAEMRAAVKAETGLTVSAGIAPNKMLAKIAADINKPDGQCFVPADRAAIRNFIQPLSVRKIPGVGRVNERWLEALGVLKIADIYPHRGRLNLVKKSISLDFLLEAYLGLGSSHVEPSKREDRKSVGRELTFRPISGRQAMEEKVSLKRVTSSC